MIGVRTAEGLVLCAASRLVTNEVRPCTADTGGACCLVGIDHDMVLGSLFHYIEVVVVHRLRVVVVATWDDVAHVTSLHSVVAVFVHQVESLLHVALVVLSRT